MLLRALSSRSAAAAAPWLAGVAACLLLAGAASAQVMDDGVRVVYAFSDKPGANCEIELTRDSVRFLSEFSFREAQAAGVDLEESARRRMFGKRALTDPERDSAAGLMVLASRWKGYKRFVCRSRGGSPDGEGYAFSLWSDSLLLACDNCFSCTEGVTLPDARVLARFGRISLWLYGLREAWRPQ